MPFPCVFPTLRCSFIVRDCHIGWPGAAKDSTVFKKTLFYEEMDALLLPDEYLVGDQAYALGVHVMKPYQRPGTREQFYYNYKQSAARRCVEQVRSGARPCCFRPCCFRCSSSWKRLFFPTPSLLWLWADVWHPQKGVAIPRHEDRGPQSAQGHSHLLRCHSAQHGEWNAGIVSPLPQTPPAVYDVRT